MMEFYVLGKLAIHSFFQALHSQEDTNCFEEALLKFCGEHSEENASQVYKAFLFSYRMTGFEILLDKMQIYEETIGRLISKHRDHYVHSINVFILGIIVFQYSDSFKNDVILQLKYEDNYPDLGEEFIFRWGITALFHDIGYSFELVFKATKALSEALVCPNIINENGALRLSQSTNQSNNEVEICFKIEELSKVDVLLPLKQYETEFWRKYEGYRRLMQMDSSIGLMATLLSRHFHITNQSEFSKEIIRSTAEASKRGIIDHGIMSAVVLLKWSNRAYSLTSWNPAYFYFPILHSAEAIFLHNYYEYGLKDSCLNRKMKSTDCALAYLLILCDNLQEFDRKSHGNSEQRPIISECAIEINDSKFLINYTCKDSKDITDWKHDICRKIEGCLDMRKTFRKFDII